MEAVTAFTSLSAVLGGALIGLAAVALLGLIGQVAGISGIAGALLTPAAAGERAWRLAFLAGLLAGAGVFALVVERPGTPRQGFEPALLVLAGLLVGYGTSLARGCTSGHSVCGLARLSPRSLAAVAAFLLTGIATAVLMRHAMGSA